MKHSIQPVLFSSSIGALLKGNQLPTSDLEAGTQVLLFAVGSSQEPIGIVGIQVFGSTALLRSLVVSESERGKGLGAALVLHAEQHATSIGINALYLLTTTATKFFEELGYRITSRKDAPSSVAATSQFSSLCPASSAFMAKVLRDK